MIYLDNTFKHKLVNPLRGVPLPSLHQNFPAAFLKRQPSKTFDPQNFLGTFCGCLGKLMHVAKGWPWSLDLSRYMFQGPHHFLGIYVIRFRDFYPGFSIGVLIDNGWLFRISASSPVFII